MKCQIERKAIKKEGSKTPIILNWRCNILREKTHFSRPLDVELLTFASSAIEISHAAKGKDCIYRKTMFSSIP